MLKGGLDWTVNPFLHTKLCTDFPWEALGFYIVATIRTLPSSCIAPPYHCDSLSLCLPPLCVCVCLCVWLPFFSPLFFLSPCIMCFFTFVFLSLSWHRHSLFTRLSVFLSLLLSISSPLSLCHHFTHIFSSSENLHKFRPDQQTNTFFLSQFFLCLS